MPLFYKDISGIHGSVTGEYLLSVFERSSKNERSLQRG